MTASSASTESTPTPPVETSWIVLQIAGMKRSTIEKKIISEAPLPRPRSVICSPSHMTNTAPAVRKSAISVLNPKPGDVTAPCTLSVKIE